MEADHVLLLATLRSPDRMNCNNFIYQTRQPAEVAVAAAAPIPDNSFSFASKVVVCWSSSTNLRLRQAILVCDALGRRPARYLLPLPPEIVIRLDKPYDAAPLLSRDIAVDRCQWHAASSSPACALLLVERTMCNQGRRCPL